MHPKHLSTLEFPQVLDRLATYSSFSAGENLARALTPATDLREIRERLETTSEARALLEVKPDTTLGGARDIRQQVQATQRGATLPPPELLDVRDTLVSARTLHRLLTRLEERFPHLADIAGRIQLCPQIINEINRCLDDRANVRDDASPALARIRREERIAHGRIQDKLQRIISSPRTAVYLQEALITQREGRYVIPLKSDFRGRIRGVVHDVSASGATIFIEPLAVVDMNNTWRELQIEEEQEIHRILAHLSDLIAESAFDILHTLEALAEVDLAFAKAKYAEDIEAAAPELPTPTLRRSTERTGAGIGPSIRFFGARHPLLDPDKVVPIDVMLEDGTRIIVITGPNTGGKTVSLKTVGLLTAMAQAGLHLPIEAQDADGRPSTLSPFETIFADIGDEQSIEQNLSTFSSHLSNILSFLDQADERSLVLLDELGAGTDPAEGAALARSLLDHFRMRGATTFVATHYPELKTYAQLTPGVRNACVEFDTETLSPTYKLTVGLPGRSNAFAIAQRLGLPHDIVDRAQKLVSPDNLRTEDMLEDIHQLRIQAAQARDEANQTHNEMRRFERELRERLKDIEQERGEILEQAREDAAAELETLHAEVRTLRRRLQAAAAPLEAVTAVEEGIATLSEELADELEHAASNAATSVPSPAMVERPIRAGDTVWVGPLNALGQVLAVDGEEAEVQVGPARTRVSRTVLELRAAPPEEPQASGVYVSVPASPGTRLDLRGCTVEEALGRLDQHLDAAMRADLPYIQIVHGKGTGALRRAVREFLVDHPVVSSYEAGGEKEGGAGVTVAKLVV